MVDLIYGVGYGIKKNVSWFRLPSHIGRVICGIVQGGGFPAGWWQCDAKLVREAVVEGP